MSNSIKVFAPATVANVACGFDIFGFAVDNPGDEIILKKSNLKGVKILSIEGDDGRLPLEAERNTAGIAIIKYLEFIGAESQGFEMNLKKLMPLGSGLGSSAASAVAGVFAANELMGKPLTQKDLLPFATVAGAKTFIELFVICYFNTLSSA